MNLMEKNNDTVPGKLLTTGSYAKEVLEKQLEVCM
jgi:hypothetical protein